LIDRVRERRGALPQNRCALRATMNLTESSVKISEAFEFETETAAGWRSDLPENVIWQVDSLQI
jgi:hypothetical protein